MSRLKTTRETVLVDAARDKNEAIVRLLLKKGANLEAKDTLFFLKFLIALIFLTRIDEL
jgi:hypothetical protein